MSKWMTPSVARAGGMISVSAAITWSCLSGLERILNRRMITSPSAVPLHEPVELVRRTVQSVHRRLDDGHVLLRRSAADSDAGDHPASLGERHAAAHRGVPAAGDGEEGIELRARLHEGNE